MAKRWKHTEEFKLEAVKLMLARGERSVADVAESLGVAENLLYSWRREYGNDPAVERTNGRGEFAEEEFMRRVGRSGVSEIPCTGSGPF